MPAVASTLPELLHRVFGHREFRAHQQPVCEAAASGRDVLLVMPTGAGKSLCYQLPALARGGTALVISPLIALMDDQATKLQALNLRVGRIHSGLPRESSREVCRDYLSGNLDFLFIAPERLRVPGFPEMLARRKPALIAVDEAHCISAWGHDFRPDYRTLGQHLPALRPAPVIALTATATPTVQKDILRALNLQDPAVFITGFRRDNLQIEATELSKPQRTAFIAKLLADAEARPAIVYASSRKAAEEIASALGSKFPAAAYHAGLDAGTRERVQRHFLAGKLDVVVATIAFGMGVDKADVRTVIHAALPGSVEAYYQEIGRAGRDGQPSRAILLHSFADRKMHDFFIERDYPAVTDLGRILASLQREPGSAEALQQRLKMDLETVQRGTEKLIAQGAASTDPDGTVYANGEIAWQGDYELQVNHRREQVDRMVTFASGTGCRMAALVRHFGDSSAGATRPCGVCDSCNPQQSTSAPAAQASGREKDDLLAILTALKPGGRSTGKLFTELNLTKDRKDFDRLLDGLARAGLVHLASESFRAEDGRDISFRKASLTAEGRAPDGAALATVWLRGEGDVAGRKAKPASGKSGAAKGHSSAPEPPLSAAQNATFAQLKEWRATQAKSAGVPAFLIFGDAVLRAIATASPANVAELGTVRGVGPDKLDRYAAHVLAVLRGTSLSPRSSAEAADQGEDSCMQERAPQKQASARSLVSSEQHPQRPASRPHVRETVHISAASSLRPTSSQATPLPLGKIDPELDLRLREWRREQASQAGLPTFFILSETALRKVAATSPKTLEELRVVAELSSEKLARYGAEVIALCKPLHAAAS